jgi:hypothetical protein
MHPILSEVAAWLTAWQPVSVVGQMLRRESLAWVPYAQGYDTVDLQATMFGQVGPHWAYREDLRYRFTEQDEREADEWLAKRSELRAALHALILAKCA